jgi:DNA-binding transcriptional MerR regulator
VSNTNNIIAAFTEEQVARLTGISPRQLRYWAGDGFFVPSIELPAADLPPMRLYSFRDLVCLKVINALRNDAKISLTEVYRQRDLPPAANCGRVVGVMTSVVLAQAALRPADASTGAA